MVTPTYTFRLSQHALQLDADANHNLDDMSDVDLSTPPTTGDVITWDGTKWIAFAPTITATEILDIPTAETDTALVLAPDGVGGVEFRAETGGGGGSGLLAKVRDTGGSNQATTSSTLGDIDTGYAVTFTAPASGKVRIAMHGMVQFSASTAGGFYSWGLREGSTQKAVRPVGVTQAVASDYRLITAIFYISGLTPGNSYTYKGAHKVTASAQCVSVTDNNDEARSIEVWDDPT